MFIKVKGSKRELTFDADHITKTYIMEGGKVVGISIEITPRGDIKLPRDGNVAYVMNDAGKTIDTIRWPEEQKAEMRYLGGGR